MKRNQDHSSLLAEEAELQRLAQRIVDHYGGRRAHDSPGDNEALELTRAQEGSQVQRDRPTVDSASGPPSSPSDWAQSRIYSGSPPSMDQLRALLDTNSLPGLALFGHLLSIVAEGEPQEASAAMLALGHHWTEARRAVADFYKLGQSASRLLLDLHLAEEGERIFDVVGGLAVEFFRLRGEHRDAAHHLRRLAIYNEDADPKRAQQIAEGLLEPSDFPWRCRVCNVNARSDDDLYLREGNHAEGCAVRSAIRPRLTSLPVDDQDGFA